ncbi:ATP/GTP-binding protein [Streptomyces sp. NPDC047046]|uniref:GTP-binding protein n=1 Tax=unclassified Streptomyces TaxID=2593676 RepID=UPI0033DCA4EA
MDFNDSDLLPGPRTEDLLPDTVTAGVKLVVVGGFGVGKTTMVGSVSEIRPLTTEETMSKASIGVDSLFRTRAKTATTVAMDFGRIRINDELVLYLFGTPGQERFWFLWNGLFEGALGGVVLVDTRRLETSFEVMGRLEEQGVPYVVAVNRFPKSPRYPAQTLRAALDLPAEVPIVECDARERSSSKNVLLALVHYLGVIADRRGPRA